MPRWFDTLDECCLSEYTWDGAYETCMGTCLFYNDWEGTCVTDCQHDLRLDLTYLTVEECCDGQYTWAGAYDSCMKLALPGMNLTASPTYTPTQMPSGIPTTPQPTEPCSYYSNFVSGCVNDCKQKGYEPMHETLEVCCTYHHDWIEAPGDYEDCMAEGLESERVRLGLTKSPTYIPTKTPSDPPTSLSPTLPCKYYTNYKTQCVNDCMQTGYEPMHDSLVACCIFHHDWIEAPGDYADCVAGGMENERGRLGLTKSPTYLPTKMPSDPPTSLAPTGRCGCGLQTAKQFTNFRMSKPAIFTGPCPYYSNFVSGCVNDCEQQGYEPLYGTLDECCFAHHGWIPETPGDWMDCMGLTAPPTLKPTTYIEPVGECLFYSNYATGCLNDCNERGDEPLHETLEACCLFHHNYIGARGDWLECMGLTLPPTVKPTYRPTPAPSPEPVSSCMYYSDFVTGCKNDCLNENEPVYETMIDCCNQHHYWFGPGGYEDCSGIPFPIPVAPPPPASVEVASSSISLHNKKGVLDDDPQKIEDTPEGDNEPAESVPSSGPAPPPTLSTTTTELFYVHKKMGRDDDQRNLRATKREDGSIL